MMTRKFEVMKTRTTITLCILLTLGLLLALPVLADQADNKIPADAKAIKLLSIAESQHEIIQLLIQKKEYGKAIEELRTIIALNLPEVYEEAVCKEILIVTKKLYGLGQTDFAYQALEIGFTGLKSAEYRARILNVKAFMLKRDGKIDEAIAVYKQEVELRERASSK